MKQLALRNNTPPRAAFRSSGISPPSPHESSPIASLCPWRFYLLVSVCESICQSVSLSVRDDPIRLRRIPASPVLLCYALVQVFVVTCSRPDCCWMKPTSCRPQQDHPHLSGQETVRGRLQKCLDDEYKSVHTRDSVALSASRLVPWSRHPAHLHFLYRLPCQTMQNHNSSTPSQETFLADTRPWRAQRLRILRGQSINLQKIKIAS